MTAPNNARFAVAVHVLTYLAGQPGCPISSETLSLSTNVNAVHVRKVLGPLRAAGLVVSRPGVGGGWQLGRPAELITLADVWTTLQGDDPLLGQHRPSRACPIGNGIESQLGAIDRAVGSAVVAELRTTTVRDLVTEALRISAVAV